MPVVRVVFYTRTSLLDSALSLVRALSRAVELHLVLEIAPESWRTSAFELEPVDLPAGIGDGAVLARYVTPALADCWRGVAGFTLVVHRTRSVHPATWLTSRAAMHHIRALRPDVVHFDDASLRLGWAIHELRHVPLVFSIHDPEPHSGEDEWRTRLAYWLTLRRASRIILHSQTLKGPFCARFGLSPDCVDVVRLGAYDLYRAWDHDIVESVPPQALFFGRLSPYKGLDVLYAAAPRVAQAIEGLQLIIAGRPNPGYSPPRPSTLPNRGRILTHEQYITNQDLAELFGQSWLVVCPYVDATQSGVIMTAYAFDKPVIATSVGGLPEYVHDGHTGLLIPPRDSQALADALIRALGDVHLRRSLVAGVAQARESEFNWNRAALETLEVYSRAVAVPILGSSSSVKS